VADDQDW